MITDVVLVSFEPSSPHYSQRIDGNEQHNEDNTYYHILTHAHTTKNKQTQTFRHRYRPTSFQVARGLHSYTRTVVSCMMRMCSHHKEGSTTHALWHSLQVRAVCTERADWTKWSLSLLVREKSREKTREGREKERNEQINKERTKEGQTERRESKKDREHERREGGNPIRV